ncbi:MAG: hypothetical protein JWO05_2065 [Gemmatimonadetes bacterium]|nr:hypothetical protein [Gemmatimonadota bacterium]
MMLLQSAGAIPTTPLELITNATLVTKVVLGLLAMLSLLSWSVTIAAWRDISGAMRAANAFQDEFERTTRLDEAAGLARRSGAGVLPRLFSKATHFVANTRSATVQAAARAAGEAHAPYEVTLTGSQVEALQLVLDAEGARERDRLGRFLPWLATIGSASPLIGLLGTVLGVIEAFVGIATKGSGNIAAVAPGVAEALIATAAALVVAIPATFAYNILASRLNRFADSMENFGTSVIALLVREGHI